VIFDRLCEGESLTTICKDPALPCMSTVHAWRKRFPDFAEMMRTAREIQAELFCDVAMDMVREAKPDTAYMTHVQLTHLRWTAGNMAPARWRTRPVEPEAARAELRVLYRGFKPEVDPQTGAMRVVAYCPNPDTGRMEREDAPGWTPPPDAWLVGGPVLPAHARLEGAPGEAGEESGESGESEESGES
jgi:hypothetical protein